MDTPQPPCHNNNTFLTQLRLANQCAGVEPEVVDLIEAYASLKLQRNQLLDFYQPIPKTYKPDKFLLDFLAKNQHLDQRVQNFLISYYQEINSGRIRCIFNSTHLSQVLETPLEQLQILARSERRAYHSFYIPKKNGSRR